MQPVIRPGGGALLTQNRKIHLGEDSIGLGQRSRRGVVGQRHPGGGRSVLADTGVVILIAEAVTQPSSILAVTTAGYHGVDVQLIDRPGETIPGTRISSGTVG